MTDTLTTEKRSELMSRIRSKNTRPELIVRRLLHSMGFRFRLHRADLPGKPDIVLARYGTVVFVNGCFWHGHSCPRGKRPSSNRKFWDEKIEKNIGRDRQTCRKLRCNGWHVLTIWECQTKNTDTLRRKLQRIENNGEKATQSN
ncbi:very short patch repair endonuclease [Symmachiella dynata]|uniref:very short patch repair endonuclease n=1 Tax=Symmachiella dynata TaxID=2527995 RepID=UPI0011A02A5C